MQEVTNKNFKEIYPQLECILKNASFIAIDTELTGIGPDTHSLFDSAKQRYEKQRYAIQPYIIVQFGLVAFQRTKDENEYTAQAFNFFLSPRSIPSRNREFLWQVAAMEFLIAYDFDFNKAAYDGISYLDEEDQAFLQQYFQKKVSYSNMEKNLISYKEEDDLRDYINQVAKWLNTSSEETSSYKINAANPILQYLVHKELRNRFPNIWTLSGNNEITVMKVQPDLRRVLEKEEGSILENVVLDSCTGFSKVFNLLVTLKKPIIAHNAMLDFMFIYQQFYRPLPQKYAHFKDNIHQLFPIIYDTKFLSYKLRDLLHVNEKWKSNSLGKMYDYFVEENGIYLAAGSPVIKLTHKDSDEADVSLAVNSKNCHTAGWDAYYAGYIFIKMIHVFATKQFKSGLTVKNFTHTELMSSVKDYANCINIIRCHISNLKLDGPEPASTRPKWLYVKTSNSITPAQIAEKMSVFGAVDVKEYASKRVLVAVSNHRSAYDILEHFRRNKELHIVPYNPIRHSPSVQFALWSGLVVSSGILVWMLRQKLQKTD